MYCSWRYYKVGSAILSDDTHISSSSRTAIYVDFNRSSECSSRRIKIRLTQLSFVLLYSNLYATFHVLCGKRADLSLAALAVASRSFKSFSSSSFLAPALTAVASDSLRSSNLLMSVTYDILHMYLI